MWRVTTIVNSGGGSEFKAAVGRIKWWLGVIRVEFDGFDRINGFCLERLAAGCGKSP